MAALVTQGIAILTSVMSFVTESVFGALVGIFVALGTVGGLISIFRR